VQLEALHHQSRLMQLQLQLQLQLPVLVHLLPVILALFLRLEHYHLLEH
jgi:hypothetical protein